MSQAPVCAKCRVTMRCKQNDFIVEEMADTTAPYRVWSTDLWECRGCGAEVVTGFAPKPMAEQWMASYGFTAAGADLRYWPCASMVPAPACAEMCPVPAEVRHIDGDPRNNDPSNLRIETRPESHGVGQKRQAADAQFEKEKR